MRTRVFVFIALMSLALPLLAEDQKFSAMMQFSGGKAEAITSFSWGVSNTATRAGGGGSTGKAVFSDFNFTKPVSQLSNTLFQACATGKHFPSVVITMADKKGNKYYEIKLTDVFISSYQLSSGGGDTTEATSLNYANIEYILIGL